MKHRIFLCAIFLLSLLLLPLASDVQAKERWEEHWNPAIAYEYDAATGTVTLTGTGELTITPHYYPWGNYAKDVKKVVIGEGITGIGEDGLKSLYNLQEVVLPESVTSIGRCAFQNCSALKTINLSGITFIDAYAFDSCRSLTAVDIGSVTSLGDYAFQGTGLKSVTIPKGITVIPRSAFTSCTSLQEVILHDQISVIGYSAFQSCTQLTSMQMPGSLKEVDDLAFSSCTNLADVQLNEGLEVIGHGAFSTCSALARMVIPDSVKTIASDVFWYCSNLQSIHFGAGLSCIDYTSIQRCTNLTTITISKNNPNFEVHQQGLYTKNPRTLVAVAPGYAGAHTVLKGTVAIGPWACNEGKITSITIPGSVKLIDEYAFSDCKNLKTVSLEDGIEEIKMSAFARSGITEITIPASVKKMGADTFSGCASLTKVVFLGLPPEVGNGIPGKGDVDLYYPGYLPEWKNATLSALGYYFTYIPDCMGRHDLRWEVIEAPTCTEPGQRSETWCTVCRQTVDPEGELPATGHSYGAWTTVTSPTTEKEGVAKRSCENCNATEKKAVPKLDASDDPPETEPSTSPATDPSQPATSKPPETTPSVPEETQPSAPSNPVPTDPVETQPSAPSEPVPTDPDTQTDSPALWLSVVAVGATSVLIGMAVSFVIFALKRKKK